MNFEWIAMEHHRLHLVEEWPDSPHKAAALAAIHSTLQGLLRNQRPGAPVLTCEVCLNRQRSAPVVKFPETFPVVHDRTNLAA